MNACYGREHADVPEFITNKGLFRSRCYIGGEWVTAQEGDTIPVINPSTDERIGSVPKLSRVEVERAIEAAHAGFPSWRARAAK